MRCAFLLARFIRKRTVGSRDASIQHSSGCRMLPNIVALQAHLADQLGICRQRDAADQIAEPGKILGRGVQNQVRAAIQRMLKGGTEQRVIDHEQGRLAGAC